MPAGGDILVEPFLSSVNFALKSFGFIGLEVDDQCPSGAKNKPWQYHLNGQWFDDETLTVTCNGEGPTTTSGPMPTTSGGSGGDTTKPNPVGFQRTIIFVEKVVQP